MGIAGLTIMPWALAETEGWRAVFGTYLILALGVQYAIKKDIGGQWRALLMGIVDLLTLTFFVHQTGSASTMLVSLYFLIGTLNALLVSRRVAMALALMGVGLYTGVLFLETIEVLPYAPAGGAWANALPTARGMTVAAIVVSGLLLTSTLVVSGLREALRKRERELLAANAQLEELSIRDPLTQLVNRRHLVETIDAELRRVKRGAKMALLMVDLDGFKKVNDDHGHLSGDKMLVAIADALARVTRQTDTAGRYGGDEFLIVLVDADIDHARKVAERLVATVRETSAAIDVPVLVTASVGIAIARASDNERDVVRRADEAAYRAKVDGGDRAVADLSAA